MRRVLIFVFASLIYYCSALALDTAFVAPVSKDPRTLLHSLSVYMKTPLQLTKLQLHLGGYYSWVDCYTHYSSSTYRNVFCDSLHARVCSYCYDQPPSPVCGNYTCQLFPENPVIFKEDLDNAITDALAFPATAGGSTRGQPVLISNFVFSCAKSFLRKKLAKGVSGLVAVGRSNHSLLAQVSNAFNSPSYFALCLSSLRSDPGVALFGSRGPYYFMPRKIDLSRSLLYTPLILNPVGDTVMPSYGLPSAEYFIGLTSIKVNGKLVPLNKSLLAIDEQGSGGTKLSTVNAYTVLETSIYKAFVELFVKESAALSLTVTNPVKPFDVCYPASAVVTSRMGPMVPTVDLVMESDEVFWRVFGSNSMVRIAKLGVDVWCLGFVDGGANVKTPVVIGGRQMEDNLLQFDLEAKRLGFSSSLLQHGTTCSNFNFTKNNR